MHCCECDFCLFFCHNQQNVVNRTKTLLNWSSSDHLVQTCSLNVSYIVGKTCKNFRYQWHTCRQEVHLPQENHELNLTDTVLCPSDFTQMITLPFATSEINCGNSNGCIYWNMLELELHTRYFPHNFPFTTSLTQLCLKLDSVLTQAAFESFKPPDVVKCVSCFPFIPMLDG